VINNSRYYSVKFKNTEQFKTLLNSWGVWKENGVFPRSRKPFNKITHIEFQLTDLKQTDLIQLDDKKNTWWSSNMNVKNNNTLFVYVYLNPSLLKDPQFANNKDNILSRFFFIASSQSLYHATLKSISIERQSDDAFYNQIRGFLRSSQGIPFEVSIIKK
jgi:hypothetical protein